VSPVFSPIANLKLGADAALAGTAALAEANDPRNQILTPGFQREVEAAGGADKYAEMVRSRIPNLTPTPKVEMSGTIPGRPEVPTEAVPQAQAAPVAPKRPAYPQMVGYGNTESRLPSASELPAVRQMLQAGGLRGTSGVTQANVNTAAPLASLFALTAGYTGERGRAATANQQALREYDAAAKIAEADEDRRFRSGERALDRELTREEGAAGRVIDIAKARATFRNAMKPDIKIGTIKEGLTERPVVYRDGEPVTSAVMDAQGNITRTQVRSPPTTEQIHVEAGKRIAAARNPAQEKARINEELRKRGIPLIP